MEPFPQGPAGFYISSASSPSSSSKPPSRPASQLPIPPRSVAALRATQQNPNLSGSVVSSQLDGTVLTQDLTDGLAKYFNNPHLRQAIENDPDAAASFTRIVSGVMANGDTSTIVSGQGGRNSVGPGQQDGAMNDDNHNTMFTASFATLDPAQPPPIIANAWEDEIAQDNLHKTIDNMLYYETLAARYATLRRHLHARLEMDLWSEHWEAQEAWAVQSATFWAKNRLRLEGLARASSNLSNRRGG